MSASGRRTASIASVDPASPPSRTLHGVRQRTADSMAVRAVQQAEDVDGAKIGVVFTLSRSADEQFLGLVASAIRRVSFRQRFLFAIGCPSASPAERSPLVFCGTTDELVQRAGVLSSAKFLGRVTEGSSAVSQLWICSVRNLAATAYDELALWDCLRKAARAPADPPRAAAGGRAAFSSSCRTRAHVLRGSPHSKHTRICTARTVRMRSSSSTYAPHGSACRTGASTAQSSSSAACSSGTSTRSRLSGLRSPTATTRGS
ncbi:hypothetical protein EVJ58_g10987 [Rhodofomes roseus]|uniref:Uncharacterized protein n=1 Tax=Rhodofomes roseus TaxID=34475 RepID=A0A4Y9XKP9_9APHY|nr:hypothetical protein EVJ58_g10987 [Rhodofomes roseus]